MSSVRTASAAWAFATTKELAAPLALDKDMERQAALLACLRAVRSLFGADACVSLLSRPGRSPLATVTGATGRHWPKVSISHRDGVGAAIVSHEGDLVGIDIERVDAVQTEQRRLFLTRRERAAATRLSPTTLWSLKEAAWKALELDASVAFHELELEFANSALKSVVFRGARRNAVATISTIEPRLVVATVQIRSAS